MNEVEADIEIAVTLAIRREREQCKKDVCEMCRAKILEAALRGLYQENADYIRINHLGDVHHNKAMREARDALGDYD